MDAVYLHGSNGLEQPAFIVGESEQEDAVKYRLLVCGVPANHFVDNVEEGNEVGQFSDEPRDPDADIESK